MRSTTLPAGIVVVALLGGIVAAGGAQQKGQSRQAFNFAFEDINPRSQTHGQTLALADLYKRRGVVLQFVASWCKPCRDELPSLQRLYSEHDAPIVLVAADEYGMRESMLIVAERNQLTAPLLFVPQTAAAELEQHYDHEILPATYLIDKQGAILGMHQGAMPQGRLTRAIETALGL